MRNENTPTTNVDAIRDLIDQQIEAVRNKDIEASLASYADDVLSFDVIEPLRFMGKEAIRKRLKEWFSSFEGAVENEIRDLHIEASDHLAFSSRLNHVNAKRMDGLKLDMWWRETTCFKKSGDRWMITHVHSSVPFNVETGKASLYLKPEES